jgi:hypothetical protein
VLELLGSRELRKGVYETREGVCRLGTELARELARGRQAMRDALTPHAAQLAKTLSYVVDGWSSREELDAAMA